MALRGRRCLLDRRFAVGGNDNSMFISRARGEDRRPVRRSAARGNDRVDPNPWDLEVLSTLKEAEPVKPVWGELPRDEEYPTNDDIIYDSSPSYDEYEDEDWYTWFIGGLVERLKEYESYTEYIGMYYSYSKIKFASNRENKISQGMEVIFDTYDKVIDRVYGDEDYKNHKQNQTKVHLQTRKS